MQSLAHGIISLDQSAPVYGARRGRFLAKKIRVMTYRGGYHDFIIEKRLEESEDRLRLASEAADAGTFDFFPATGELKWSARCKELFGLSPEVEVNFETFLRGLHAHTWGDAARLQQVIWNLVKNAVKFTPPSGRIEISTRNPTPNQIEIVFRDNGVGIEAGLLPHIFDAFQQGGRRVTSKFGGLASGSRFPSPSSICTTARLSPRAIDQEAARLL